MNWNRYRVARNNVRANQIYFQFHGRLPARSAGPRHRKTSTPALQAFEKILDREIRSARLDRFAFIAANARTMPKKRFLARIKQKFISGDKLMAAMGMNFETAEHKRLYCRKWFASRQREIVTMDSLLRA